MRRVLKGTGYGINNLQVLELGIGKAGRSSGIIAGARFCIYFSAAYRAFELVFKDGYTIIDFIGDISMDAAKILVTIYSTQLVFAISGGIALVAGITLPLSVGVFLIVTVGFGISYGLLLLDEKYQLSEKLKCLIKQRVHDRYEVEKWNSIDSSPLINFNNFGI